MLPRCGLTELPRLLCDHCGRTASFTMTAEETEYLAGQIEPPAAPKPRHHQIRQVDYPRRRYDSKKAPRVSDWRGGKHVSDGGRVPAVITCDHGHDDTRFICDACADDFKATVADIPLLMFDLAAAYTKQVEFLDQGAPVEADPDEAPLEWLEAASAVVRDLWAAFAENNPATEAVRMVNHWSDVLRDPTISKRATRITEIVVHAHQVIDRPPTLMDYGDCPAYVDDEGKLTSKPSGRRCDHRLWQERIREGDEDKFITCPKCGYAATLQKHQVTQLLREETKPKTAGQIQEALKIIGQPVTKSQWDNMVTRDGLPRERQIIPHWANGKLETSEVWGYRLKDVLDLLHSKTRRDSA